MANEVTNPKLLEFGDKLNGDEHLFNIVDMRLPEREQKVVTVIGEHAEAFIKQGHYYVAYKEPNSSSRSALRDKDLDRLRLEFGEMVVPQTALQMVSARDKEIAELKAKLAAAGLLEQVDAVENAVKSASAKSKPNKKESKTDEDSEL